MELMVVVATIAAVASIAVPSLQRYVYRAKRSEAYFVLKGIYQSQHAFAIDTGHYARTFDELGFEILGGQRIDPNTWSARYYTFTLRAFDVNGSPAANYQAIATGDLDPSDEMLDILLIENNVTVKN